MNVLPITADDLTPGGFPGAVSRLAALMLFPDDDVFRAQCLSADVARIIKGKGTAKMYELEREAMKSFRHGVWAGQTLLHVLVTERTAPGTATLRTAGQHVADIAGLVTMSLGSPRARDSAWARFRPVAALWAATIEESRLGNDAGEHFPCAPDRLIPFLKMQDAIRLEGESVTVHRASRPVLNGEAYLLPGSNSTRAS